MFSSAWNKNVKQRIFNIDANTAVIGEPSDTDIVESIKVVRNDPESGDDEEVNCVSSEKTIKKHMQKWQQHRNISKVETALCLQKVKYFL